MIYGHLQDVSDVERVHFERTRLYMYILSLGNKEHGKKLFSSQ